MQETKQSRQGLSGNRNSKNPTRAIIQLETVSISTIAKNFLIQYVLRIM